MTANSGTEAIRKTDKQIIEELEEGQVYASWERPGAGSGCPQKGVVPEDEVTAGMTVIARGEKSRG